MAKEQGIQLSLWMKFALWSIGLIFACGMAYQQMGSIDNRVTKNTEGIDTVKKSVHRIELDAKDIKNLAATAAKAAISSNEKFARIQEQLALQVTIQAVNSEKLKTLTKD